MLYLTAVDESKCYLGHGLCILSYTAVLLAIHCNDMNLSGKLESVSPFWHWNVVSELTKASYALHHALLLVC